MSDLVCGKSVYSVQQWSIRSLNTNWTWWYEQSDAVASHQEFYVKFISDSCKSSLPYSTVENAFAILVSEANLLVWVVLVSLYVIPWGSAFAKFSWVLYIHVSEFVSNSFDNTSIQFDLIKKRNWSTWLQQHRSFCKLKEKYAHY